MPTTTSPHGRTSVRRGLVLGAGGVLGATWTMAALSVLTERLGFDPREAEVCIGTSAGSVLTAFIGCGVGVQTMVNHQRGVVVEGDPRLEFDYDSDTGGALPPRPKLRFGSTELLRSSVRHPRRANPIAALSAMVPEGRGTLQPVGDLIDTIAPPAWPTAPRTWIVAMDYESGRRTAFGSPGAPDAKLSDAVRASCSIPGWYAPVTIGGRRYVDGGTRSSTSADLLAPLHLDEVYILAPMSASSFDRPGTLVGKLERRVRGAIVRQIERESEVLRRDGTRVVSLAPTADDLHILGVNMMDPSRREAVFASSLATTGATLEAQLGAADDDSLAHAG